MFHCSTVRLCLASSLLLLLATSTTPAATVGYWRMEQDDNANQLAYSVPNEVPAGNPLTGAFGDIESEVPVDPVPLTGAANNGALSGLDNTSFSPDISGSVAYYPELDVSSITIEFFARTNEGQANFIQRRVDPSAGILINSPNNLNVRYTTASGLVELLNLYDFGSDWEHFAFTYDQATGVGKVYVSGVLVGTNDGPDGEALTWPASGNLLVGGAMDGGGGLQREAIYDELRISDTALHTTEFLAPFVEIPEPASLILFVLCGVALVARRQWRWKMSAKLLCTIVSGLVTIAWWATPAVAGTINFFTDRGDWLTAAAAAGLDVTIETFDTAPPAFPDISVGGVSFNTPDPRSTYDATNERIGVEGGGGRVLSLDLTASTLPMFGFGIDMGPTIGNIRATDVDGDTLATGSGGAAGHFVGILGTAPLDPANPFPSNPALAGSIEFRTSGLGADVYFDNLTVATGIPEPASLVLLCLGAMALRLPRRFVCRQGSLARLE